MKQKILSIDEYVEAENLFESQLLEMEDMKINEASALQEEYQKYFKELLAEFEVASPAELSMEQRTEFFNKVKSGWVKGKGRKSNEGVNENAINEDDLKPGTVVTTKNGQTGTIDSWSDTTGKYIIIIDGGDTIEVGDDEIEVVAEAKVAEAEITSDDEFKEYATKKLKAAFGEDFDQTKADKTIEGLLKKKKDDDLEYGAIIGMLN